MRHDDPIGEINAEALEHTARAEIGKTTDAMVDAYAAVHGMDRASVIRQVLNRWAADQVAVQRLVEKRLRSQGA